VSPIRRLDPEVASKIAAGEVVERPVSVAKELIENALDASARQVTLEVSDGGKSAIICEDDGAGIPAAELPLAVENFSTSKISRTEDIAAVRTLGFRGEALASIRTVSHLLIRTMTGAEITGREMEWRGDELVKDAPCVRQPGTEVIVKNLFFNLPARRKFLGSGSSELRRVTSLVQSYALSAPTTGFTLKGDRKDILVYPVSTLDERIEIVFGANVFPHLKPFESSIGYMRLHGFISLPDFTRGNRTLQYYFVNGRYIKDRLLIHAVHQAYQSLIPRDRFPLLALFLEMPTAEIDVNVHPTKAEIRFRNEREIHRFVSSALQEVLRGGRESFRERVQYVYGRIFPEQAGEDRSSRQPVTEAPDRDVSDVRAHLWGGAQEWLFRESPKSLFDEERERIVIPVGKLYWQLHESFILTQIRGGMVIIDQHAAHERILYNAAKRNIDERKPAIQSLLFPATLELTPIEYERFEELSAVLPSVGFEVEPFGANSIIVRGIPAGVRNWNDGQLLQEILSEGGSRSGSIDQFLKTYACRAAVKAGMNLSVAEMESLTDQLFATEFPFTCPHGRPTMLRVDLAELERRFQRTVSSEK